MTSRDYAPVLDRLITRIIPGDVAWPTTPWATRLPPNE